MQRSLWQIRCIARSVQRTAAFMNIRMWHFPEGYISDKRLTNLLIAVLFVIGIYFFRKAAVLE